MSRPEKFQTDPFPTGETGDRMKRIPGHGDRMQRRSLLGRHARGLPVVLAFLAYLPCVHAQYTAKPWSFSGNVQTQQIFRHPAPDKWSIVQQRNTVRLRLEYDWIQDGRIFGRLPAGWAKSAHFVGLYRGSYDSVYDFRPGPRLEVHPYKGRAGRDASLSDLNGRAARALRFDSTFREVYTDVELAKLPLTLRLGRQMVVWGESDNLRMLDRTNALDATWHGSGVGLETWDDLRIPYWMIRATYNLGQIGRVSDAFLETYWVPGLWFPLKLGYTPGRPWSFPFANPFAGSPTGGNFRLLNGSVLGRQGDYDKSIGENSQVGVRLGGTTPSGLTLTLNYLYQRTAHDDGVNTASLRGRNQCRLGTARCPTARDVAAANAALMARGILPAEAYYPYTHTVGFSASYADDTYTEGVFRMETIYEFGKPFADKRRPILILDATGAAVPSGFLGVEKSDVWQAFVGFDRATWIRSLNRRSTFFLTGQVFWQYIPAGTSRFQGQLSVQDKVRNWEMVGTIAASTLYLRGKLLPTAFYVLDPINRYSSQFGWLVDYYVTPRLIVRIAQSYFFVPGYGGQVDESWGLGGLYRRWDETVLRLTYQF